MATNWYSLKFAIESNVWEGAKTSPLGRAVASLTLKDCFVGEQTGKGRWMLSGFWEWQIGRTHKVELGATTNEIKIPLVSEWWQHDRSGRYDWPPGGHILLHGYREYLGSVIVASLKSVY